MGYTNFILELWIFDHIFYITFLLVLIKFTTTFLTITRHGSRGNSVVKSVKVKIKCSKECQNTLKSSKKCIGMAIRDVEAAGSNPVTSTNARSPIWAAFFALGGGTRMRTSTAAQIAKIEQTIMRWERMPIFALQNDAI